MNKLLCLFFLIGTTLVLGLLCACGSTHIYESKSDYLKADVPLTYSEHAVFPDEKALNDTTVEFYRSESRSTFLFDDIYFLLKCTFSQESLQQEIRRIEKTGAVYNEEPFSLPAYIVQFRSDRYYEYALIDTENCSIIYVSAEISDWEMFPNFPAEYLPITQEDLGICVYNY